MTILAGFVGAGFVGVRADGGVYYARTEADMPEFSAQMQGDVWHLAIVWPLRATAGQLAGWNARYPDTPMDVDTGETRMRGTDLAIWGRRVALMAASCIQWRRETRQRDEGM